MFRKIDYTQFRYGNDLKIFFDSLLKNDLTSEQTYRLSVVLQTKVSLIWELIEAINLCSQEEQTSAWSHYETFLTDLESVDAEPCLTIETRRLSLLYSGVLFTDPNQKKSSEKSPQSAAPETTQELHYTSFKF
ncbi:MAG: hypothetical protein P4M14_03160 [Gammaproteobacteria bacterium]|nr:hypothetical protein [Gammaproteobacteria bacterium]